MSQKNLKQDISIKQIADQIKQLTFQLRGEINTATILAEFLATSGDGIQAEYGTTLYRSMKNVAAIIGEFEKSCQRFESGKYEETDLKTENKSFEKNKPIKRDINSPQKTGEILVVEDNIVNQTLIRRLLERMGFHVTTVGNGEDAVSAANGQAFDLILMDITLPGIDGFETTRQLKRNETSKDIPVVALSARNEYSDKVEATNSGMSEYLTKPVDQKSLSFVLKKIIQD